MRRCIALLAALAAWPVFAQTVETVQGSGKAGTPRGGVVTVQTDPAAPLSISGAISVSGTADTPGNTATYNANNVCSSVLTAGEQSAGFHLTAGTLDATLTPYYTNQTGAVNCATAGTCTQTTFSSGATIIVTNPSGVKDVGINVVGGVRQVEVCTTTFSGGSASGAVTATFVQAASSGGGGGGTVTQGPAAAANAPWFVELSDGASGYTGVKTGQVPAALDGSGFLKTHEQGTATVSGTVAVSNSFALDATLTGGSQIAQVKSGTKGASSAALVTSTANGVDHQGLDVAVQGNTTVVQPTGTNLHAVLDTTSTTAVTQATGTNLHAVIDSGSTTAATQATAANLNAQVQGAGASGATKAGNPVQVGAVFNTTQPTVTTGQTVEAQATARGAVIVAPGVDGFAVSGTVTTTPPSNASSNVAQVNGVTTQTGAGTAGTGTQRVAVADSDGVVLATANSGRLQVDVVTGGGSNASVVSDGAAPAGSDTQVGASVTTAAPTYTTGQVKPLSLNTAGGVRVDGSGVTQPVSGTVTTTPPANASTNVAQLAGTTTDTNSGAKSAGTLRVVLATDQPALTNKLLVTPDANSSVNLNQVAGSAVATGHGTAAGAIRVELPTDGTGVVNAAQSGTWTVTTTPPSNASTNVAQFGGTNVSTGTGAGGAGIPRVTVSNDSTVGQAGTWTVQPGNTQNTTPWLTQAPDTYPGAASLSTACADPGTGCAGTAVATLSMQGIVGVGVRITGASLVGDQEACDISYDTTTPVWVPNACAWHDPTTEKTFTGKLSGLASTTVSYTLIVDSGVKQVRIRMAVLTSGTATVQLSGSTHWENLAALTLAPSGQAMPPAGVALSGISASGGTANQATVKSGSTAAVAGDTSIVVQLNPSQPALTTPLNTNTTQIGGNAITTIANGEQKVGVEGTVASGATAAGNPLGTGGRAATTVPTAVSDTQRIEVQLDKFGKNLNAGAADRALISQNAVQVSTTAETTLLAQVASTFLDLTAISCSHSSTTAETITVRDTTAGTARLYINCPAVAGPCEGWTFTTPFKQTTVNTNWTIQEGGTDATVSCVVQAVQTK